MLTLSFKHRYAFQFENVMITKPRRISFRWNSREKVRHNYLHNQIEFIIFACVYLPTEQFWQQSNHIQIPDFSAAAYSSSYYFQLCWWSFCRVQQKCCYMLKVMQSGDKTKTVKTHGYGLWSRFLYHRCFQTYISDKM